MTQGVIVWAEVAVIHESVREHVRGKRGKQLAIGSKTKSRGKVWIERAAEIAAMSGSIGTGLPEYSNPEQPVLDPEFVKARNILREANDARRGKTRPVASVHEDVPQKPEAP